MHQQVRSLRGAGGFGEGGRGARRAMLGGASVAALAMGVRAGRRLAGNDERFEHQQN